MTDAKRIRIEHDEYSDMSYMEQDEFADTDPADYVSFIVSVEEHCSCCGSWAVSDSVAGCDILCDEQDFEPGTFDVSDVPAVMSWTLEHFEL